MQAATGAAAAPGHRKWPPVKCGRWPWLVECVPAPLGPSVRDESETSPGKGNLKRISACRVWDKALSRSRRRLLRTRDRDCGRWPSACLHNGSAYLCSDVAA
eukprot:6988190-Prymnesium_polylepis.3